MARLMRSVVVGGHVAKVPEGVLGIQPGTGVDYATVQRLLHNLTYLDIGGMDTTSWHVDAAGNMWMGAATYAAAPFKVSSGGAMTATTGTFSGAIDGSTIDIGGADATSFHVDATGRMWMGDAAYSSAPLRVSAAGIMEFAGSSSTMSLSVQSNLGRIDFSGVGNIAALGNVTMQAVGQAQVYGNAVTFGTAPGQNITGYIGSTLITNTDSTGFGITGALYVTGASNVQGTCYGSQFVFYTDTDTGIYRVGANLLGMAAGGQTPAVFTNVGMTIQGSAGFGIHLYTSGDNNHRLIYSSATPSGSGSASNGPVLQGYSSVWLNTTLSDKHLFLLDSSGSCFLSAAGAYTNFSARRLKKNIKALAPEAALAMVNSWQVRAFDWKVSVKANRQGDVGFIADEMYATTPDLVEMQPPPGGGDEEPATVNYPGTTPYLAGAIQALTARLDAAMERIAELEAAAA